jgi:hypothetical protein
VFSYHNGDHYNSVRRIGDLNARTPSRIKLATLSLQPRAAAAVPNYRDQNNGSCSDSGAGPSDDSGMSHLQHICTLGYNEFDLFLEIEEYRPFDGCKTEI